MRKKRLNIKFIIITISLFVVVGALLVVSLTQGTKGFFNKNKAQTNNEVKEPEETKPVEEPPAAETSKFKIYDTTTKTRPYAVMINNIGVARPLQSGLQDAYIIYEMIVEGGITRYLALFRDVKVDRIGSIRSSRHYYLDYVLENDAIYVHNGQSPQAQSDFSTLGINRIEAEAPNTGIRDKSLNVAREHTLFTTTDLLNKAYEKTKFRKETNKEALLNYVAEEVDLSQKEGAKKADKVDITFSNSTKSSFKYDSEKGYYLRSVNGKAHNDYVTKEQYHFKNIITYQVKNATIKGDSKGRQEFSNIGSGKGYYITNGYAVPIKWKKDARGSQTVYTYEDGTEIEVNDGNTFIEIQPTNQKLVIE